MKASVLDLRNHMSDIMKAIDRNEEVTLIYRGRPKATIVPFAKGKSKKQTYKRFKEYPAFGMYKNDKRLVEEIMDELRGGRYRELCEQPLTQLLLQLPLSMTYH